MTLTPQFPVERVCRKTVGYAGSGGLGDFRDTLGLLGIVIGTVSIRRPQSRISLSVLGPGRAFSISADR